MKAPPLLLLASIVLLIPIGCASSRASSVSDTEDIRMQLQQWPSAAEAGDVEQYLTFVTDDVLMFPPNQPPLRGKQEVGSFLRGGFAMATFDITLHPPEELVVAGDWAYLRYRVQMVANPKAGGATTAFDRRYLDIWRRDVAGVWRCHRHMWNDSPATSTTP